MKKFISAIIVAGALSQVANAMGPTSDITHRHFYKDQEWIWQNEQTQPKAEASKEVGPQVSLLDNLNSPVAFLVPHQPTTSLAFLVPHNPEPSLAFLVPHNPERSLAFMVPHQPTSSLAFLVPHNPEPSLAFLVPHNPTPS
jgi:hypothetical protein